MSITNANSFKLQLKGDLEIEMSRVFNAPRSLVFVACSKPEHMKRWWPPKDHEMVVCDMDFRVGGRYRFVLRTQDSNEYAFRGEFREIKEPDSMSFTFEFEGAPGTCVETLTFTEQDCRTTLHANMIFDSKESRDGMVQSGMEEGARQSWDKLENLVARLRG